MSICPMSGWACMCQPDEGVPCNGLQELRDAYASWRKLATERADEIERLRSLLIEVYNHGENGDLHGRIGDKLGATKGDLYQVEPETPK